MPCCAASLSASRAKISPLDPIMFPPANRRTGSAGGLSAGSVALLSDDEEPRRFGPADDPAGGVGRGFKPVGDLGVGELAPFAGAVEGVDDEQQLADALRELAK